MKNGYFSAIVGYGKTKKNLKPVSGKLKKAGVEVALAKTREFRLDENVTIIEVEKKQGLKIGELEILVGDIINPAIFFTPGMKVDVTGISKGKGFAGVVKRHDFAGFPASHGHPHQRVPGSIGSTTTPGRVFKGLRMAGRMGSDTVTVQNLEIVSATETELVIKGQAPGKNGTLLSIVSAK